MKNKFLNTLLRVLVVLGVLWVSYLIFAYRGIMLELAGYGYLGIFLISILTNATLFLPTPGLALVFTLGGALNFWLVGLSAGLGSTIGELSGYLAGFSGQPVIGQTDFYHKIKPYLEKYGPVIIFFLAALPNPFLDAAGIAAGIMKIPVREFLLWTFLGKLIKMVVVAYLGDRSFDWITPYL